MQKVTKSEETERILNIYHRYGISQRLLREIKEKIIEKGKEADLVCILQTFLENNDLNAVEELGKLHPALLENSAELIGKTMKNTPLRSIYFTKGWFTLARKLVNRSPTLRQYIFQLLASDELRQNNPLMNSTRNNILIAILELHLLEDEIDIIRELRAALPYVYQEYCDELLLRSIDKEEQEEALEAILDQVLGSNELLVGNIDKKQEKEALEAILDQVLDQFDIKGKKESRDRQK